MALEAAFAAVTIGDSTARGVVCRAHARRLCEGHFPGEPIVPGARLAGLMAELAAALVAPTAALALLRHRGRALVVDAIDGWDGATLRCRAGAAPRPWPALLEGAAQAAGLAAGLRPGGLSRRAVVAEYRDVRVHATTHAGPLRFAAHLERRVLHFWRCRVEVRDAAGALLLAGCVTLAPEPAS